MKAAIETFGLTRYFHQHCVVEQLGFQVPTGKVTALLGLNGAGKTTTIRMMMGLLDPTRGRCETLGVDSRELTPAMLSRIGYMVEGHYLSSWMRVSQMERFSAEGHAHWDGDRYRSMVEHFGISSSQRIGSLSRGQRAGVSLAAVMAADPELLILDDPALGLDPVSRRALNETLVDFAAGETTDGCVRTVLLSTHLMDDVERIADEIAVMVGGRLLVQTSLDDFLDRVQRMAFTPLRSLSNLELESNLRQTIPGLVELRFVSGQCVVCIADVSDEVVESLARVAAGDVETLPTSLNDLVIAYLTTQRSESFAVSTSSLALADES
ncbi:ABC-type multidrug transport system, ATPase component [Rhodopirellula islandica]|uniref:ABC-type multidrug transport system, ATPase component n=1 Tax=Rhodopirellula islandica TaxID=595434 RepID=A0A0J1BFI3_RHOIS|nr:ABC transporter ATP-binding protein [Rhodopirellula islandica]KLU05310.1 ABC-type multidrug transport system, ATPase component [Rhodopirellula islandica]